MKTILTSLLKEVKTVKLKNMAYIRDPVSSLRYFGVKYDPDYIDPVVIIAGDFNTIDP